MTGPTSPRSAIRLATRADASALSACRAALFRELGRGGDVSDAEYGARCTAAYEQLFDSGTAAAWILEDGAGGIAATLTLLVHARLPTPALAGDVEGYVVGVWTRPDLRRRGLASALLGAAVAHARERGWVRLRLHASDDGRGLYTAHGFAARSDAMELGL